MGIYMIRFGGMKSELEITKEEIICVAGGETQFSFLRKHLLWMDQPRPEKIIINYFLDDEELVESVIESDHCISIMNELTAADAAAEPRKKGRFRLRGK